MAIITDAVTRFPDAVYAERLRRARAEAAARGIGALLVTPSVDYDYLLGYRAPALERLTCLVLPAEGTPTLVLPHLELPLALHSLGPLADGLEFLPWDETDDPFRLVKSRLAGALRVGLQDQMWSRFVLRLRALLDPAELVDASPAIGAVRVVKQPEEVERLRAVAAAADEAMRGITSERLAGRTEAEVSRHVRDLLLAAGHDSADFAIVASGPNSASPHHEAGDWTHLLSDLTRAVSPTGTGEAQADPLHTVLHRRYPAETCGAYVVPVLRLAQDGGLSGDEIPRPTVPVVVVGVRDQHRVGLLQQGKRTHIVERQID